MAYERNPTWQDKPSTTTPITAAKLNHLEDGVAAAAAAAEVGITVDGLPILADSATTWESEAAAMARYGLTSWTGRRRWVSIDYPDHPAPGSPNVGDIWDERVTA